MNVDAFTQERGDMHERSESVYVHTHTKGAIRRQFGFTHMGKHLNKNLYILSSCVCSVRVCERLIISVIPLFQRQYIRHLVTARVRRR